jgi:hypothetical protein
MKYTILELSCVKYSIDAIANAIIPVVTYIVISIMRGFNLFQSSLSPTNCPILINAVMNILANTIADIQKSIFDVVKLPFICVSADDTLNIFCTDCELAGVDDIGMFYFYLYIEPRFHFTSRYSVSHF